MPFVLILILTLGWVGCPNAQPPSAESHSTASPGHETNYGKVTALTTVGTTGLLQHDFPADEGYYYLDGDRLHLLIVGSVAGDGISGSHTWRFISVYAVVEQAGSPESGRTRYRGEGFFQSVVPHLAREIHANAGILVEELSKNTIRVDGLLREKPEYFDEHFELPNAVVFRECRLRRVGSSAEFADTADTFWTLIRPLFDGDDMLTYEGSGRWTKIENNESIVVEQGLDTSEFFDEIDRIIQEADQQ